MPRRAFSLLNRLNGDHTEIRDYFRTHHLGLVETLERVRDGRLSLARFGDGELALAHSAKFPLIYQMGSPALQAELQSILLGQGLEGVPLLVTIPGLEVPYYRHYWAKYWRRMKPLLDPAGLYGDTSVSREGLFRRDPERARLLWRSVWEGRDVCFIVGKGSRFDPIDSLFDRVASQRTVFSKPKDAYDDVPRVVDEIVTSVPRETLILLSLGPSATVLAARLAQLGFQALDIGHVTNAYRTVTAGAAAAEKMPVVR